MYPALRGSAGNPWQQESFYGEVEDVVAAGQFLKGLKGVDPDRIYLGGHSTGGTLVLLVAGATDIFKQVVAFGPVARADGYGPEDCKFDVEDHQESDLRAPIRFLPHIKSPTLVIEGVWGNSGDARLMQRHNRNPKLKVLVVPKIGHFGVLAPASGYLARVLGRAKEGVVEIEEAPILKACLAERVIQLDASVIRALARYRRNSLRINVRRKIVFSFSASTKAAFEAIKMRAEKAGYKLEEAEASENSDGEKSWSLEFSRRVRLDHLKEFLKAVATADAFAPTLDASFEGFEVVE